MSRRNSLALRVGQILLAVLVMAHVQPLRADPVGCQDIQVDDTGTIIGERPAKITVSPVTRTLASSAASSVSILIFYPHLDTPDRLRGLGYTVTETTSNGDLTQENLRNYDVLWIDVDGDYYSLAAIEEIQAWVDEDAGGVILVQPNHAVSISLFPPGFEVTVYSRFCPEYPDYCLATIVDPSHPITEGLQDSDLTSNEDSVRTIDIGPSWGILAVDPLLPDDAVALLAGEYGEGRMVFNTGNYTSQSVDPGSDQYVIQLLTWLSQKEPPPPPWSIAATVRGTSKEGTGCSSMLNNLAFLLVPLAVAVVLRRVRRRG